MVMWPSTVSVAPSSTMTWPFMLASSDQVISSETVVVVPSVGGSAHAVEDIMSSMAVKNKARAAGRMSIAQR